MEQPRPPYAEMTDVGKNRSVLGTFSHDLLRAARYSLIRAEAFGNKQKTRHILEFLGDTAGLDGRGREDLRDALMGARAPSVAVGGAPPQPERGAKW